jgi:hypothetical protein
LGSTRKLDIELGETIKKTKFTPPCLIKPIPITIASNSDDISTTSVSNTDDVMMTSSSQHKELFNNQSMLPKKDPPEGKNHSHNSCDEG